MNHREQTLKKLNEIAKPCDMDAWSKRVAKHRIAQNACNRKFIFLMRAAQPDKIDLTDEEIKTGHCFNCGEQDL